MAKEMGAALLKATKPVQVAIAREADEVMPKHGGYRTEFAASLRFRLNRRAQGNRATVILLTFANGKGQRRDIGALERGILRHPVYGRSRRVRSGARAGTRHPNPWSVTKIRGGFHQRGTDGAMDEAAQELVKVIDDFAHRLVAQ